MGFSCPRGLVSGGRHLIFVSEADQRGHAAGDGHRGVTKSSESGSAPHGDLGGPTSRRSEETDSRRADGRRREASCSRLWISHHLLTHVFATVWQRGALRLVCSWRRLPISWRLGQRSGPCGGSISLGCGKSPKDGVPLGTSGEVSR